MQKQLMNNVVNLIPDNLASKTTATRGPSYHIRNRTNILESTRNTAGFPGIIVMFAIV